MTAPNESPAAQAQGAAPARASLVWWDWDVRSDRVTVNGGATEALDPRWSELPATGAEWEKRIHPEDIEGTRAALRACLGGSVEAWFCEHRLRQPDGAWHWILNTGRVTERDGAGQPSRMLGVSMDREERNRLEELLSRDAQVLATVNQSIVCTDLDGKVLYWSDGATDLYGWTAEEMLGRPFTSRMPTEEMREHARMRMRTAASRGEFRHEREDFKKDGTRIFVESHVFPLRDPRGRVIGVIGTARDITSRRNAELERLQLERQLLQAQKMDTIGTLAGGVAHEFNNILSAIIGNMELALLENPDDQTYKEYHRNVLTSSWRARDLVKRLLTFSRSHEPERRPVRIDRLVAEAASLIRATLPATVELDTEGARAATEILADANELQQVLLNLAANAAYAMRDRRGTLTFATRTVDFAAPRECAITLLPAGPYLALDVADTGIGIDAVNLSKVFDPFFTTKPVGEGSGLGLSIAHSIVAGHGGGIEVASTLGVGTTFTLFFPIAPEAAPAAAPAAGDAGAAAPVRGKAEQIVVIDDEERVGSVVEKVLRRLGYNVRRFLAADEFYSELKAAPFRVDALLTDQTMPRMTGLQLARLLRVEGYSFPIAIASGHSQDLTPEALSAVGRAAFIQKPFDVSKLASVMQGLLRQGSSRHPF
jgi:PAS domain S-box-containing protein